MKLWDKGETTDQQFERFTIGLDAELDLLIAYYDIIGTIAHVEMLGKVGLLETDEVTVLVKELEVLKAQAQEGDFVIEDGMEDCHSQIELVLTQKLGEVGKKVHSGRSRNDQVLTALKLFTKAEIESIAVLVDTFFQILIAKSEETKEYLMPGYTHMQVAMPSSFGLWFGAYAESLVDDLIVLKAAHKISDKSPLGSAAGYGSSFPLDRAFSSEKMNFADLNHNVVYAQMTRGKTEKSAASAIASIASTLSKFAMDVCLYAGQNYDFLKVNKKFTTGSSIMPHKHNPDGFELVRGKCNQLQSLPYELNLILNNLPSGYHRDLQTLKESYLPAFAKIKDCLNVISMMTEELEVNKDLMNDPTYDLLFTVEEVNRLVLEGVPFRDAYKQVGKQVNDGAYTPNKSVNHTHIGSIGNLANQEIEESFQKEYEYFRD